VKLFLLAFAVLLSGTGFAVEKTMFECDFDETAVLGSRLWVLNGAGHSLSSKLRKV